MGQQLIPPASTWHWEHEQRGSIVYGEAPLVFHAPRHKPQPRLRHGVRSRQTSEFPFSAQRMRAGERMCGAAALEMTLQGLGVPCAQQELWSEIACPDSAGELAARTFHLASAALRRGMPALVAQVRDGWNNLLRIAADVPGIILNHRLRPDAPQGHFSVLVDVDNDAALLHDPLFGPRRIVSRETLEKLWQPTYGDWEDVEIAGHVLVGMGPRVATPGRCQQCDLPFPAAITCGACGQSFPLQPSTVLGCMRAGCGECRWRRLFCPFCDAAFQPIG